MDRTNLIAIDAPTHLATSCWNLSGWRPKHFPPQLVPYANTQLQDRILFGSDSPAG